MNIVTLEFTRLLSTFLLNDIVRYIQKDLNPGERKWLRIHLVNLLQIIQIMRARTFYPYLNLFPSWHRKCVLRSLVRWSWTTLIVYMLTGNSNNLS